MSLEELSKEIQRKLKTQHISPRILTDRLRVIDDSSRQSGQYQDPNYLPFYYHLSRLISPKSVLNIGIGLGLPLCCFLQGCPSAQSVLCFQRKTDVFYSPRLALANIRDAARRNLPADFYMGDFMDKDMQEKMKSGFDLIMITDDCGSDQVNEILELCWKNLSIDGYITLDRTNSNKSSGDVFSSFCKGKNRPFAIIKTRYGTGIAQK